MSRNKINTTSRMRAIFKDQDNFNNIIANFKLLGSMAQ